MTRTLVPAVRTSERRSIPWSDQISPSSPPSPPTKEDPHDSMFAHDTVVMVSTLQPDALHDPCVPTSGLLMWQNAGTLVRVTSGKVAALARCVSIVHAAGKKAMDRGLARVCAYTSQSSSPVPGRKGSYRRVVRLPGLLPCYLGSIVVRIAGKDSECTDGTNRRCDVLIAQAMQVKWRCKAPVAKRTRLCCDAVHRSIASTKIASYKQYRSKTFINSSILWHAN
jgi:hypothetical protein